MSSCRQVPSYALPRLARLPRGTPDRRRLMERNTTVTAESAKKHTGRRGRRTVRFGGRPAGVWHAAPSSTLLEEEQEGGE